MRRKLLILRFAGAAVLTLCSLSSLVGSAALATPETEAERRQEAIAESIVSRFPQVTPEERQQLKDLGPVAFRPLFVKWLRWDREYREKKYETTLPEAERAEYSRFFTEAFTLLQAVCTPEHVEYLFSALRELPEESPRRAMVRRLLDSNGDERAYVFKVTTELRSRKGSWQDEKVLRWLFASKRPEVYQFFVDALKNKRAHPTWRQNALAYVAARGDRDSLSLVRAARTTRVNKKVIPQRPDFTGERDRKLAELADSRGRQWILYQSSALGYLTDLYIVQKRGDRRDRPIFTGLWTQWRGSPRRGVPATDYGVSVEELVRGEWIHRLPDDPKLRKDSDGDGLTDLVETRLGTDVGKKDTDRDGKRDNVDPFPNAAPRRMGDAEKIIAACAEASFLDTGSHPPGLFTAQAPPFEFPGYDGLILWNRKDGSELSKCFGGGVLFLGVGSCNENARTSDPDIEFSADKKTARTMFDVAAGSLSAVGTEMVLKKHGHEWFVVDMIERWVS